VLGLEYYCAIL